MELVSFTKLTGQILSQILFIYKVLSAILWIYTRPSYLSNLAMIAFFHFFVDLS